MFVSFVVELPTFQRVATNVSDNNKQYLLHFSVAVVIRNCAWFIVLFESVEFTELYFWSVWRTLLLIHVR